MDKKRKQPAKKNHLLRQCIIEFDRFPKGNPRKAGAGVIVHDENGDVIHQVSEGLEKATSNEVEYRALTRGLKCALDDGFDGVRVRGDSKLVRKQVRGKCKVNSLNLTPLCKEAKELKAKSKHFHMDFIPREYNSEADAQANRGAYLKDGQIEED